MFKPELKEAIFKRLQDFLNEEVSNRVTTNNMTGLGVSLESIFQKHWVEPEEKKAKKSNG